MDKNFCPTFSINKVVDWSIEDQLDRAEKELLIKTNTSDQ